VTISPARRSAIGFIVCLGVVSLFADMTYEGARSVIGPYLKDLGATALEVAFIAGFSEMLGSGLRYFSGRFADRTQAWWAIVFAGYAMNVLAVPMLALAGNWRVAALLMVVERTGKALRGPARDVMLSGATEEVGHGWGFGLHTFMDQTGAVIGPLLMMVAVGRSKHLGHAFYWLGIPACATLLALVVARARYSGRGYALKAAPSPVLPGLFWLYVAAAGLLAFGFVDWPLLAYHFEDAKLISSVGIPLLYSCAMAVNGITALLFGLLFDRFGLRVLIAGIFISMLALPFGFLGGAAGAIASVGCWGTGMGVQDACLRSGIAQLTSMDKRGQAFGAFSGVFGVMWFLGSVVMGVLYTHSLIALAIFGVAMQLAAAVIFLRLRTRLECSVSTVTL
jgi:hypothetical protein